MERLPRLDPAELTKIGQSSWDVIAALGPSAPPPKETDRYLIAAAERIWNGDDDDVVADYLIDAAVECIGVDTGSGIRERALGLVAKLRAYLEARRVQPVSSEPQW